MTTEDTQSRYQQVKAEADQRWQALTAGDRPWIRVGTAMCGHAAGAHAVVEALKAELDKRGFQVRISEVGCLGICYAEPLVDILKPGGSRLFFRNVVPEDAPEIVRSFVVNDYDAGGHEKVLGYLGKKPIAGLRDVGDIPGIKGLPSH